MWLVLAPFSYEVHVILLLWGVCHPSHARCMSPLSCEVYISLHLWSVCYPCTVREVCVNPIMWGVCHLSPVTCMSGFSCEVYFTLLLWGVCKYCHWRCLFLLIWGTYYLSTVRCMSPLINMFCILPIKLFSFLFQDIHINSDFRMINQGGTDSKLQCDEVKLLVQSIWETKIVPRDKMNPAEEVFIEHSTFGCERQNNNMASSETVADFRWEPSTNSPFYYNPH